MSGVFNEDGTITRMPGRWKWARKSLGDTVLQGERLNTPGHPTSLRLVIINATRSTRPLQTANRTTGTGRGLRRNDRPLVIANQKIKKSKNQKIKKSKNQQEFRHSLTHGKTVYPSNVTAKSPGSAYNYDPMTETPIYDI